MPHISTRGRWLGTIALATLLAASGLWWDRVRMSADPMKRGLDAYARGDWEAAVAVSRSRLKSDRNDVAALHLLARASVRLGRDSSALAVYQRLGPQAMLADDLCLLGIALTRTGNSQGGLQVWEQARSLDQDHAETLFELTRAYNTSDRLTDAAETGHRLASRPGWEARAEALLGVIQLEFNDPAGAVAFWQRAVEHKAGEQHDASTPIVPHKELARALLRAQRPVEARHELKESLTAGPDPECFWLLSRAYLQEGATIEALAAWERAGSFREENPLLPEPSPFIGSQRCAECHPATYHAQQSSRHAETFMRVSELGDMELPPSFFPDSLCPKVTHTLRRVHAEQLQHDTQVEGQTFSAVVEYAFGSGDRGMTLIGHDDQGQMRELRLSHYSIGTKSRWDVTSGHVADPSEVADYLGRPLTNDAVRRCFLCHVTDPRAVLKASGPVASDRGIGCEKCHGPGGNHLLAVQANFPDVAIAHPSMASGSRVVRLCAQCHSPRGFQVWHDDPASVRFQGTTLTWSRCFTESKDILDCVTCHDPHRNVVTSRAHYEAKCLSCHASATRSARSPSGPQRTNFSGPAGRTTCPVNPTEGCISCHMPTVPNAVPHSVFTDHFIRVHRN